MLKKEGGGGGGDKIRRDGFKKITDTKIHVAVDGNGLPISIVISSANAHDGKKFVDVVKLILDFADGKMCQEIISVYADKGGGYDGGIIRDYLKSRNIISCIPKRNFKKNNDGNHIYNSYNKTRFVVERFFAWLKNGFHRTRIRIRYEKKCRKLSGICLSRMYNDDVLESFRIS